MDTFKRAVNRRYIGLEKETNQEWKGSFRFIQAADTQFGMIHQFQTLGFDFNNPRNDEIENYVKNAISEWPEEIRLTTMAIDQWNRMVPRPRFVVVCGDLVNEFPGAPLRRRQLDDLKKTFSTLNADIPLVLLPGNHDILDRPTPDSIQQYRDEFGDDYFAFWVDGVLFLVINAQYYKDATLVKELADQHERWIDEMLNEAQNGNYKHIVVFQHIPWFIHDPDEPDSDTFNITIKERKRMLKKFNDAGVRAIFCGHYHRNAGGHYEDLELIVTSAVGAQIPPMDERETASNHGYRIVDVQHDRIEHRYIEIESSLSTSSS